MWHMGDGWGWWMLFGTLMMAGFWGIVLWAIAALIRGPRDGAEPGAYREPTALEILERRYASGELSDEVFEVMKQRLLGDRRPSTASRPDAERVERR